MASPKPRVRQYRTVSETAVRAVVVLFALAWLLAGGAYYFSQRAVMGELGSRASVTQVCQGDNEQRAQQITLWTHLVAISAPPPHQTAAQRDKRKTLTRQFLAYVRQVFKPRDCGAG